MTNRFLSTASVSDLTKASLVVSSLSANNLNPSQTLKTDSNRRLVSSDLAITDVTGLRTALDSTITTPYDGQLEAADFVTPTTTLNALATMANNLFTKTQQIQYAPTYVQGTAIVGRLGLFSTGQDPEDPLDSPQGQLLCGTVRATSLSALSGPTLTLSSNLDCQGVDVLNAPSITQLQQKTEAISRPNSIATAIVGQLLVYEGGDDPTSNVVPLGAISCGTLNANDNITANADLVVYGRLNDLSVTGGKYSQTGPDVIVQNTALARSIINYGVGSLVFDSLRVGDNYHIKLSGSIQTDDNKDQQLQLVFRLGFTTIHTTTYIDLDSVGSSYPWELELDFTIREGTLVSNAQFTYNEGGGRNDYRGWSSNYETIIDTSTYMNLTCTAQWDTADPNNILTVKQFLITKTY